MIRRAAAALAAFLVLIALGFWQIHRLHWKEAILSRIAAAEVTPPRPLEEDQTPDPFARVIAHGDLRGDRVALYGAEVRDNHMGAQAIEVLDRVGSRPVLVMLGWVPTDHGKPHPIAGPRDVTGYIRLPDHAGWLSAPDDLAGPHFYTLDPSTIGAALGETHVVPYTLVVLRNPLGAQLPADAPQPADALPQPSNNHLQYALTWFGLAAALAAVFVAWAVERPRTRKIGR